MMQEEEAVNVIKEGKKIGEYSVFRRTTDAPQLPIYEMHAYDNEGKRTAFISCLDSNMIVFVNAAGERGMARISQMPPTALATQAAHVLVEHGDKSPKQLGELFFAEVAKIASGQHKQGRKPGDGNP